MALIDSIDPGFHLSTTPEALADEILAHHPSPNFGVLASLADSSGRPLLFPHELTEFMRLRRQVEAP